jgi:CarboxypepD_reg-like domain
MINHRFVEVCKRPSTFLLTHILILISNWSISQTPNSLTGVIRNSETKLGIPYVSIGIEGTTLGVVSNENGVFKLAIPKEYVKKRCFASCIGYKTAYINLNDGLVSHPLEISLEEDIVLLEQIYVKATGETPLQVLKEAARITKEKSYAPAILHTYYREFVKKNSSYTEYADGLIDYYLPSMAKWNRRSAIEVKVNESRSEKVDITLDTGLDLSLPQVINLKILPSYCNPERIVSYFTKDNSEKYYVFSISEDTAKGLYLISVSPNLNVKEKLYSGKVYIDKASMVIRQADIEIPSSHLPYTDESALVVRIKIEKFRLNIQYQISNEKCFIKHMRADVTLRAYNKKRTIVINSFVSEFVINKIDFDNISQFKKEELFKKSSLQKNKTKFQNEFWFNQSGLVATSEEESIINNLNKSKR